MPDLLLPPNQSPEGPCVNMTPAIEGPVLPHAGSPFPSHSYVIDACSLQVAVARDPNRIFDAIQNLVNERDAHKAEATRTNSELKSVTDDLKYVRQDYKAAREKYQQLFRIADAKQVILWKFVEKLQQGHPNVQLLLRPSLGMDPRGNGIVGIAMEKWISEGMEGDRSMKSADDASDQDTETSFWSAEESLGGRRLDPHAVSLTIVLTIFATSSLSYMIRILCSI